jgi:hypothetical protein
MTVKLPEEVVVDSGALRRRSKASIAKLRWTRMVSFISTPAAIARRLGYDDEFVQSLPDAAVESLRAWRIRLRFESFRRRTCRRCRIGCGFRFFRRRRSVGPTGRVVGVDMTEEMLTKSRATAAKLGLANVEFREGWRRICPSRMDGQTW